MTHRWTVTVLATMMMLGGTGASAAGAATAPGSLVALAELFAERPTTVTVAGFSAAHCGQEGHCSYTDCIVPECPPGSVGVCNCKNSEDTCDDAHNPWNPFDNDTHAVFNCDCGCDDDDPEPEPCRVVDPLDPEHCLVPGSNDE